jgi:hypothetical protein
MKQRLLGYIKKINRDGIKVKCDNTEYFVTMRLQGVTISGKKCSAVTF